LADDESPISLCRQKRASAWADRRPVRKLRGLAGRPIETSEAGSRSKQVRHTRLLLTMTLDQRAGRARGIPGSLTIGEAAEAATGREAAH
jgi:hypothetical protein